MTIRSFVLVRFWRFARGLPKQAAALKSGRIDMKMNAKNITIIVAAVIVVAVGGYYLTGSGGGEETVAPAAESE